ncbi:hypothetical protein C8R45DRAFT_936583 [Mycena sanguinolenta]|nr:hypothetical protein C8R45DRAFT_936583 [Mycena sanguinolenta]
MKGRIPQAGAFVLLPPHDYRKQSTLKTGSVHGTKGSAEGGYESDKHTPGDGVGFGPPFTVNARPEPPLVGTRAAHSKGPPPARQQPRRVRGTDRVGTVDGSSARGACHPHTPSTPSTRSLHHPSRTRSWKIRPCQSPQALPLVTRKRVERGQDQGRDACTDSAWRARRQQSPSLSGECDGCAEPILIPEIFTQSSRAPRAHESPARCRAHRIDPARSLEDGEHWNVTPRGMMRRESWWRRTDDNLARGREKNFRKRRGGANAMQTQMEPKRKAKVSDSICQHQYDEERLAARGPRARCDPYADRWAISSISILLRRCAPALRSSSERNGKAPLGVKDETSGGVSLRTSGSTLSDARAHKVGYRNATAKHLNEPPAARAHAKWEHSVNSATTAPRRLRILPCHRWVAAWIGLLLLVVLLFHKSRLPCLDVVPRLDSWRNVPGRWCCQDMLFQRVDRGLQKACDGPGSKRFVSLVDIACPPSIRPQFSPILRVGFAAE